MRTGRRARHEEHDPAGPRAGPRSGRRAVGRGPARPDAADVRADRRHLLLCDLPATETAARKASGSDQPAQEGRQGGDERGDLGDRSEEHTSELQSRLHLVCRLLLEKKKKKKKRKTIM